jgi:hypothetical protein
VPLSFFCLDTKETKNQGKPDCSARFSRPARGKSRWIDIKEGVVVLFRRCGHFPLGQIEIVFTLPFHQNKNPEYL